MARLERITTDPSICHGQPTIRGLRYPVDELLELLASGMMIEEVIEDHPDLEPDDLLAAVEFGALTPGQRRSGAPGRFIRLLVDAQHLLGRFPRRPRRFDWRRDRDCGPDRVPDVSAAP
jgi:uncharacterized protein (DUF433 family)